MAIIRLSDGTNVKSEDIDHAALYAKSADQSQEANTPSGSKRNSQAEDRLYVVLKDAKVLRLVGQAVHEDAAKLLVADVPVFINEDKES